MRKKNILYSLIIISFLNFSSLFAQDIGVISVNQPTSDDCDLTTRQVQVDLFNYSSNTLLGAFDVKFQLNNEVINVQSELNGLGFGGNSTKSFTFLIPVDFSNKYGLNTLKVYTDLGSDLDRLNDTISLEIRNYEPTDGGSLSLNDTVCKGTNSGTIEVMSHVGDIVEWQFDEGNGWIPVANTVTTYTYSNLEKTTLYRVKVKNGNCSEAFSNEITITVNEKPDAGLLTGGKSVCPGENGDTLKLENYFGNISKWELNAGAGWIDANNEGDTLVYDDPISTISYRVLVDTGVCSTDTSNIVTVELVPSSTGGNIASSATVCSGMNNDSLILQNYQGNIIQWERSEDNGSSWTPLVNTDSIQEYVDLTKTRLYRVLVEASGCPSSYSDTAEITVDEQSNSGVLFEDKSICGGIILDTLILKNYNSSIVKWQFNDDGNWTDINNTDDSLFINNVSSTTKYRSIVESGVCSTDTSNIVTIEIVPSSTGGDITSSSTVCSGMNNDSLILQNYQGDIVRWERSEDNGSSWTPIVNTDSIQEYVDLTKTRLYRVLVESSGCPSSYSDTAEVTVDEQSNSGVLFEDKSICGGTNLDTLILENYNSSIVKWQFNDTGNWTDINNTDDSLFINNISSTTKYRSIVKNGVCPNDTSNIIELTVISTTVGGNIEFGDSVCLGNNGDTLNLKNFIGDIRWWERSTDNGISWSPIVNMDSQQQYADLQETTWYRVLVEGDNCPNDYSDTAVVTVYSPEITISFLGNLEFCDGDSVILSVDETYSKYSWSNLDSTQSSIVTQNGFATVVVTDNNDCKNSDSVEIVVNLLPTVIASDDVEISLGATTILEAGGADTYSWSPGSNLNDSTLKSPSATPLETTLYIVTGVDIKGCVNSDSVLVTTIKDYNFKPKNVITPNGDGFNDVWNIEHLLAYPECTVSIFNRYGSLVFKTREYMNTWDGSVSGEKLPDGTYYYIVTCPNSESITEGHITILSK
jgi:gliding motility-associated-like protein